MNLRREIRVSQIQTAVASRKLTLVQGDTSGCSLCVVHIKTKLTCTSVAAAAAAPLPPPLPRPPPRVAPA